mgnify:FL=1
MRPTVGRIVMYTNLGDADGKYPPEQQAAIITSAKPRQVLDLTPDKDGLIDYDKRITDAEKLRSSTDENNYDVTLAVFYRTGLFFMTEPVPYSSLGSARGHWHWPERA